MYLLQQFVVCGTTWGNAVSFHKAFTAEYIWWTTVMLTILSNADDDDEDDDDIDCLFAAFISILILVL